MTTTTIEASNYIHKVVMDAWKASGGAREHMEVANLPFAKPVGEQAWCRVTLRHSDGPQTTLAGAFGNKRRYTQKGVLFVQLFCKLGTGDNRLYEIAGEIRKAINTSRDCGVWFRNARLDNPGVRALWNQMNVIADFEYDIEE